MKTKIADGWDMELHIIFIVLNTAENEVDIYNWFNNLHDQVTPHVCEQFSQACDLLNQ